MDYSKIPAAPAPPGYTQNFENPEVKHRILGITIAAVGIALSTLFLIIRVYTKAFLARLFGVDDVTLIIAWIMSVALQAVCIHFWYVKYMGVHMWDLFVNEVNAAAVAIAVCTILYIPLMALAKFSILFFYHKLSVERWWKYCIYGVMVFTISYSIALVLALIFACSPLKKNWDITVTEGTCINKGNVYLATASLNAGTDVILLLLPLPLVTRLQVSLRKKIGLTAMFSIGSLTLITSLIRLSLLPPLTTATDITWAISTPAIWICIEASLMVICGCLPIMRLFLRHVAPGIIGESNYGSTPRNYYCPPSSHSAGKRKAAVQLTSMDVPRIRTPEEWEHWERELMKPDDSSETYTVNSTGRIVVARTVQVKHEPRLQPVASRSEEEAMREAADRQRTSWFDGRVSPVSPVLDRPTRSYVIGRSSSRRHSLRRSVTRF